MGYQSDLNSIGVNVWPEVTVKTFGAKGDGVTNDTQAVQNAMNSGGLVYFPPGTYLIDSVTVKSNTKISGAGKGVTILKLLDAPTGPLLDLRGVSGNNKEYIEISDLTLKHNKTYTQSGYSGILVAGDFTRFIQMRNVEFAQFNARAIYISTIDDDQTLTKSWRITECIFQDGGAASVGIQGDNQAEYMVITDCSFHSLNCAIRLTDSANVIIHDNTFLDCGIGIDVSISSVLNGGKTSIQGCKINHSFGPGIKITSTRANAQYGATIIGNDVLITTAGKVPIQLIGLNGGMVANNRLEPNGAGDPGIIIQDNGATVADYNMIVNNLVMLATTPVNNTATGTHNTVTGNIGGATG